MTAREVLLDKCCVVRQGRLVCVWVGLCVWEKGGMGVVQASGAISVTCASAASRWG